MNLLKRKRYYIVFCSCIISKSAAVAVRKMSFIYVSYYTDPLKYD